ncbi:MAG: hydantoinase B/oxoprolinase family protein [Porticoccaceae bacterium]
MDPITGEVIRSAFDNIANEMSLVLLRTSGSPVLTESKDFSTVLFDADLNQIGASGYILLHMASGRLGVQAVAAARAPHDIQPGDAFICNDPYTSGALHQGDVGIVMPIFYGDDLIGWNASTAHLMDVGGSAISGFAPEARDTFSEALRFPGTRIARNAVLDAEWVGFMRNNVRVPVSFISDLRSLVAACNIGSERMRALVDEYGLATLNAYTKYNIELTEKALRERISRLPDGAIRTYDFVEYDGFGTSALNPVFCEMTIAGERMQFQFSGCPQIAAFVNSGRAALEGSLMAPIMCQFAPDIPFNEGFWNCIEIDRGEPGTIVNPVVPAPVTSGHASAGMRAGRMVQEAIVTACAASDDPDLRARVSGQASGAVAIGIWFGMDHKNEPCMFMPFGGALGIGGAGQTVGDGQDGYGMQSTLGIRWSDVEVQELDAPILLLWRRLLPNAGGAGALRGGMATDEAYKLHAVDGFNGITFATGAEIPARGFSGGLPGGTGMCRMIRGTQVEEVLARGELPAAPDKIGGTLDQTLKSCQTNIPYRRDDVFWSFGGGGGGLGDPFLRAPANIEADLNQGMITLAAAQVLYGAIVIGDGPYRVDAPATWKNRDAIRAELVPSAKINLAAAPRETICQGAVPRGGAWRCSHCDAKLDAKAGSWVEGAVTHRRDLADLFGQADTQFRRRAESPVILVEHYCPFCASCLMTEVQLEGAERETPTYHLATPGRLLRAAE